jgi:F-type H+-transporting ATPase subunit epsilon
MNPSGIQLRILLPYGLFLERSGIRSIVAETQEGLFGILPHRLDCAAALVPGILTYKTEEEGEVFVALDEGSLVKTGYDVVVCARNATTGANLGELRKAVDELYGNLNEDERAARSVLSKLESHFIRQLMQFGHEQGA